MNKFLASVSSLTEAQQLFAIGADIIDLKQPAQGALGALDEGTIHQILAHIAHRCPVSATIGDIPMHPESVFNAVDRMCQLELDYVKIGFFPEGDWLACITKLRAITAKGHAIIAVLFADTQPSFEIIEDLSRAGFKGVMLDTVNKSRGSLTDVMSMHQIAEFVTLVKQQDLLCGLAGSLTLADIAQLSPLHADYLGFRGALCVRHQRTAHLDLDAIHTIKTQLMAYTLESRRAYS